MSVLTAYARLTEAHRIALSDVVTSVRIVVFADHHHSQEGSRRCTKKITPSSTFWVWHLNEAPVRHYVNNKSLKLHGMADTC